MSFYELRAQAREFILHKQGTPNVWSLDNFFTFLGNIGGLFKLILRDPEIILFAVLQSLAIAGAYMLWTKGLDWIPDYYWDAVGNHERFRGPVTNCFILGWSLLILLIVSYPIAIFTSAIVASRLLRENGQNSTIIACMIAAMRYAGRLWLFSFVDAWITMRIIIKRLPKRRSSDADDYNYSLDTDTTVFDEFAYYAWKIGSIGIIPSLLLGNGVVRAGKESLLVLRRRFPEAIGLRLGYSLACWIIAPIMWGATYWYLHHMRVYDVNVDYIHHSYEVAGLPIAISIGIVCILLRPFFLLYSAELYMDAMAMDEDTPLSQEIIEDPSIFSWHSLLFLLLVTAIVGMVFWGNELGVRAWVEGLAALDLGLVEPPNR